MYDLINILHAMAGSDAAALQTAANTPEIWIATANGRPEWEVWGKGRPQGSCPAHPLLCHMADVTAVAGLMVVQLLAPSLRERLLALHPGGPEAALRWLLFVIALHDLGKVSPAFVAKLAWAQALYTAHGYDLCAPQNARHHGDLGMGYVYRELKRRGASVSVARAFARAVAAHHGDFPTDVTARMSAIPAPQEAGAAPRWLEAREGVIRELAALFGVDRCPDLEAVSHADLILLAGLTAVADWIGSMDEVFEYVPPQPSLVSYWPLALSRAAVALERAGMRIHESKPPRGFAALFPELTPWPLHIAADGVASALQVPTMVVVEAPMGEGKTEAALLLAEASNARLGQRGHYLGLPTKATANQMLGRVRSFLERAHPDRRSTLVLAHGDADLVESYRKLVAVYDRDERRSEGVRADAWFLSKKRALLAEYGVGTIDQTLLGVMRTTHLFVRLFGLAGKAVIFDEVHAYDTYTSTLLDRLVEWLGALGTPVVLLSATLPSERRAALLAAYRKGAGAMAEQPAKVTRYPRITTASHAGVEAVHVAPRGASMPVAVEEVFDDIPALARRVVEAARHGCVGWICNTVDRAQDALAAVRALDPEVPRLLLHARLLPEERAARERRLESWLGPEQRGAQRPERCVVVGTQVLEQSLDVDFDVLFTDLAPIDLLLQRTGRVHRHKRGNRSPRHPQPKVFVARPEGPWETVNLDAVAAVYAEVLARGTLQVLQQLPLQQGARMIVLPDDIEGLVETVYCAGVPPEGDTLHDAAVEHVGVSCAQRQDAERRLLPRPNLPDDIFGAFRATLDDDEDPGVHEQLRAMTRDGDPSVDVVCLVRRGGAVYANDRDGSAIDLEVAPGFDLAKRLVRRSIAVSKPSLVRSLLDGASYHPAAWRESALLRYRRCVVFEGGEARVGDHRLRLDPELGLVIERKQRRREGR